MDTDMTDAAYDIDIDVGADPIPVAQQPQQVIEVCSFRLATEVQIVVD